MEFRWNLGGGVLFGLFLMSCSISKTLQEGEIDSLRIASVENKAFLFKSVGRINV